MVLFSFLAIGGLFRPDIVLVRLVRHLVRHQKIIFVHGCFCEAPVAVFPKGKAGGICTAADTAELYPQHEPISAKLRPAERSPRSCFSVGKSGGQTKRLGNVERDRRNLEILRKLGWQVLIVWECQIRNSEKLNRRLRVFLKQ